MYVRTCTMRVYLPHADGQVSVFAPVYLTWVSVRLPSNQPANQCTYLSTYLLSFICHAVYYLSVADPSISLSVYFSIYQSISLHLLLFVCLSVHAWPRFMYIRMLHMSMRGVCSWTMRNMQARPWIGDVMCFVHVVPTQD